MISSVSKRSLPDDVIITAVETSGPPPVKKVRVESPVKFQQNLATKVQLTVIVSSLVYNNNYAGAYVVSGNAERCSIPA